MSAYVEPVRLRPVVGDAIGTTAFFRNRTLLSTLLEALREKGGEHYSVLFHACSIGAEVYSLVITYFLGGFDKDFSLSCFATDKEPAFVDFARGGVFPEEIVNGLDERERAFFEENDGGLSIAKKIRDKVTFLNAGSFLTYEPGRHYDVVFLLNALVYVDAKQQAVTYAKVAGYCDSFLVTTAFHQESIEQDIQDNGFKPCLTNIETIHESWVDRRCMAACTTEDLPANIYTDPSLPPFAEIEGFQYKFCAIFTR